MSALRCQNCGAECGGHYGARDLPSGALPSDPLPASHPDYRLTPPEVDDGYCLCCGEEADEDE